MGRIGKKTVLGTSVDELLIRIIDAYIEQEKTKKVLARKKTRPDIIQDAVLNLLWNVDNLDSILQSVGVQASEVENIKARLKAEYGISPVSAK